MAFRDDRDALRDKAEGLQADLQRAEQQLDEHKHRAERVRKLERDLGDARAAIARIEEELSREQGRAPGRASAMRAVVAVVVAMFVIGVGISLFLLRAAPDRRIVLAPSDPVANAAPIVPATPPAATPYPDPSPSAAARPVAAREVERSWAGRVKQATGLALAPGARCTVAAKLHAPDGIEALSIECSGKSLYRSSDKLEGMSSSAWGFEEIAATKAGDKRGTTRFRLRYQDQGARLGPRTQASVDSSAKTAVAWMEGATAFRVEITLDELSNAGEPLDEAKLKPGEVEF